MNILLTGASGFTGRHFISAALAAGHAVHALEADLTQCAALAAEIQTVRPTHVLHLAGISFVGHLPWEDFYRVNVIGTGNLLETLSALPDAPQVLLASSANVYGNSLTTPIGEHTTAAPLNHYANSKLAMEQLARIYANRLSITVARLFNYTGVGQSEAFLIPKLVRHFSARAATVRLGNIDVEREFNDVRDVCAAYLRLLALPAVAADHPARLCNLCSGKPVTLRHILMRLEQISGHRLAIDEINKKKKKGSKK